MQCSPDPNPSVRLAAHGTRIAGRIGLPLLLLQLTAAGVMSIWITAGLTWVLAGVFCVLRYASWKKGQEPAPRPGYFRPGRKAVHTSTGMAR